MTDNTYQKEATIQQWLGQFIAKSDSQCERIALLLAEQQQLLKQLEALIDEQ